jgi:hypothetical protein
MTFKALILESSVISVSCIPETKYSCSGLPERFSKGSTAMDLRVTSAVSFLGKKFL